MRIVLAYPLDGFDDSGIKDAPSVVTVSEKEEPGWPGPVIGPDWRKPLEVVDYLAVLVEPDDVLIPLCEEVVLPCWKVITSGNCKGYRNGPACVDRHRQRLALNSTGLDPRWWTVEAAYFTRPCVIKAPASTLSEGVQAVDIDNPRVEALEMFCGKPDYTAIIEEFIPGPQYEISGFFWDKGTMPFTSVPLMQTWEGDKIASYYPKPASHKELSAIALQAGVALGIE